MGFESNSMAMTAEAAQLGTDKSAAPILKEPFPVMTSTVVNSAISRGGAKLKVPSCILYNYTYIKCLKNKK